MFSKLLTLEPWDKAKAVGLYVRDMSRRYSLCDSAIHVHVYIIMPARVSYRIYWGGSGGHNHNPSRR